MLRRLSFEVTLLQNAPLQEMEDAVNAFNLRLREGGMGLFYFSGHGVQADGENYLIPIKARIDRQQDVRYQALPMGRVIGAMEDANNGLNILILDACRNMPFSRSFRSSQGGLAPPPTAPRGMLIAYATSPGGMAADGAGENGVYTKYLLQAMALPGLSIEQVFKQVRYGVVTETEGKQTPWESSSLLGDFAFMPAQADLVPAGVPPPLPLIRLRSGDGAVEHERAVVASGGCAGLPPGLSGESLCPCRPPTPAAVTAAEHLCCQCAIRVAAGTSDAVESSSVPSVTLHQCSSPTVYRTSRPI